MPGEGGSVSRRLIVVACDELSRYAHLQRAFISASVEVLLDRRRGDRRQRQNIPAVQRRRGDRRVRSVADDLRTVGWALVNREADTPPASTRWAWGPGIEPARIRTEVMMSIDTEVDVVSARDRGREIAARVGLSPADSAVVATAVSELARNILAYARRGEVILREIENESHQGIEVVAFDEGPGILDVDVALKDGSSTSGGLGMGLPGVRRLMDEFHLTSRSGLGTSVTIRKWRN